MPKEVNGFPTGHPAAQSMGPATMPEIVKTFADAPRRTRKRNDEFRAVESQVNGLVAKIRGAPLSKEASAALDELKSLKNAAEGVGSRRLDRLLANALGEASDEIARSADRLVDGASPPTGASPRPPTAQPVGLYPPSGGVRTSPSRNSYGAATLTSSTGAPTAAEPRLADGPPEQGPRNNPGGWGDLAVKALRAAASLFRLLSLGG